MVATYRIQCSHPTMVEYCNVFFLVVKLSGNGNRYVTGSPFGCSRDYYVNSDSDAINIFLREHGCTALTCELL